MIGTTIGRYEIIAELGRGANGVVWKARHTLLPSRLVALKVLSEDLWSSSQARDRFLREAIAVSKLDHPGIATLYEAEEVDGQLYIAFKLIDGGTVAQHTAKGPLPLRKAVTIGRDAAEALAHAHAQGVIHRDLSAGNVMVDREGRGVLVDFGLARAGEQSATATVGLVAGTLPYMPPETLRGEVADARSDIYSLGAVLYRMITGRAPFEGEHAEEIVHRILTTRPAPPSASCPAAPPRLDDVVLRALERNPRDRYPSAAEMARALEGVLELPGLREGAQQRVSPLGRLLSNLRRRLRRRSARWAVGIGAAVLVAGAVLGIAWLNGWRPAFLSHTPTVAVLPARNLSSDPGETAYLAEGLGEEIVSRLSEVQGIRVLPWMTSQRFNDPSRPIRSVAHELHAEELLVSSYQSDGERIRVNVGLVDGRSGAQRWSERYEESAQDLFAIQREIAEGVASRLKRRLTSQERSSLAKAPSSNPEAYEYFIRGANYLHAYDAQSMALAQPFFDKALELDPNLAEAWVGRGAINNDRYFRGDGGQAELNQSERCFRRALELNPTLAAAEQGLIRAFYERGQSEEVLKVGKAAAERGPNDVDALLVRGWAYALGGLPEKAVPVLDRILELDPANQSAAWCRVFADAWSEHFDQAIADAKAYIRKFGEDPEVYTWLGAAWFCKGDRPKARLCLERALDLFGEEQSNLYSVVMTLAVYREMGERDRLRQLARHWTGLVEQRLAAHPDNLRLIGILTGLYAYLGRREDAERTVDQYLTAASGSASLPGSALFLLPVLAANMTIDKALAAYKVMRTKDLGSAQLLTNECWRKRLYMAENKAIESNPDFQAFLAAIRQHHADLAARY